MISISNNMKYDRSSSPTSEHTNESNSNPTRSARSKSYDVDTTISNENDFFDEDEENKEVIIEIDDKIELDNNIKVNVLPEIAKEINKLYRFIRILSRDVDINTSAKEQINEYETKLIELMDEFKRISNGQIYCPSKDLLSRDFCEEYFYEFDKINRNHNSFIKFYIVNCRLVIQGCKHLYIGQPAVIHAFLEMFDGLHVKHQIIKIDVDIHSKRCDSYVTCLSAVQIEDDSPRMVTEIFELNTLYNAKTMMSRLICSRHYFIVTDRRPLYYYPEPVPLPAPDLQSIDKQSDELLNADDDNEKYDSEKDEDNLLNDNSTLITFDNATVLTNDLVNIRSNESIDLSTISNKNLIDMSIVDNKSIINVDSTIDNSIKSNSNSIKVKDDNVSISKKSVISNSMKHDDNSSNNSGKNSFIDRSIKSIKSIISQKIETS